MSVYDLGLNQFDSGSISGTKFFVLGIGGGNDVVGAYALARLLKKERTDSDVLYGSCLSSNKKNYVGFVQICEGLYIRDLENHELNENHSLRLVQTLKEFDGDLCVPYVIIADDKREAGHITKKTINYFKDYTIITIDNEVADIFSPMLNSISNPERKNTDTTVIIVEVRDFIEKNQTDEQLYLVPRHERETKVPYVWINKAVVFDGEKLVL